jgi:hypothetical protein
MDDNPYESNDREEPAKKEAADDTDLLPRAFFAGKSLEPGSKCEVEIVHVYDDEVAVKYVAHKASKDDEPADDAVEEETEAVETPEGAAEATTVEEPATASVYD